MLVASTARTRCEALRHAHQITALAQYVYRASTFTADHRRPRSRYSFQSCAASDPGCPSTSRRALRIQICTSRAAAGRTRCGVVAKNRDCGHAQHGCSIVSSEPSNTMFASAIGTVTPAFPLVGHKRAPWPPTQQAGVFNWPQKAGEADQQGQAGLRMRHTPDHWPTPRAIRKQRVRDVGPTDVVLARYVSRACLESEMGTLCADTMEAHE
ncbi:hypothetical protein L227DRAFT_325307 [Lentinus tigrinus ALCF2SS1-6]|uniref:Uncharacterized protein n=1 Tax=Lentinus tigrinus ALCF2SS1-6 TaxID=1328759 RepID=A0A5C2SM09_9APHY|nr:hypothetical protein L227DRAFT_325307 [Lentinus tigrinus ALCF2SS1-6]